MYLISSEQNVFRYRRMQIMIDALKDMSIIRCLNRATNCLLFPFLLLASSHRSFDPISHSNSSSPNCHCYDIHTSAKSPNPSLPFLQDIKIKTMCFPSICALLHSNSNSATRSTPNCNHTTSPIQQISENTHLLHVKLAPEPTTNTTDIASGCNNTMATTRMPSIAGLAPLASQPEMAPRRRANTTDAALQCSHTIEPMPQAAPVPPTASQPRMAPRRPAGITGIASGCNNSMASTLMPQNTQPPPASQPKPAPKKPTTTNTTDRPLQLQCNHTFSPIHQNDSMPPSDLSLPASQPTASQSKPALQKPTTANTTDPAAQVQCLHTTTPTSQPSPTTPSAVPPTVSQPIRKPTVKELEAALTHYYNTSIAFSSQANANPTKSRSLADEYKRLNKKHGKKVFQKPCSGAGSCDNLLCDHKYAPRGTVPTVV
jgi:hypothetical protein